MAHLKVKLNGGIGSVCCSGCSKILRNATSRECLDPRKFAEEYCDECLQKIINEEYKHWI